MATTQADLIDELGGGTKVAAALSQLTGKPVDREAVYKWKEFDNIPLRWRASIVKIAREKDVPVPDNFLEELTAA